MEKGHQGKDGLKKTKKTRPVRAKTPTKDNTANLIRSTEGKQKLDICTPKQTKAISMYVMGVPISEICDDIKVNRRTFYLWMKKPCFIKELQTAKSEVYQGAQRMLKPMLFKASRYLARVMDEPEEKIKTKAVLTQDGEVVVPEEKEPDQAVRQRKLSVSMRLYTKAMEAGMVTTQEQSREDKMPVVIHALEKLIVAHPEMRETLVALVDELEGEDVGAGV